jgi:hypothetical protein
VKVVLHQFYSRFVKQILNLDVPHTRVFDEWTIEGRQPTVELAPEMLIVCM